MAKSPSDEREFAVKFLEIINVAREHMLPHEGAENGGDCDLCPVKHLCDYVMDWCSYPDDHPEWYEKLVLLATPIGEQNDGE